MIYIKLYQALAPLIKARGEHGIPKSAKNNLVSVCLCLKICTSQNYLVRMKLTYFLFHKDTIIHFARNASIILLNSFYYLNLWMVSYTICVVYCFTCSATSFASLVHSKILSTPVMWFPFPVSSLLSYFACMSHLSGIQLLKLIIKGTDILSMFLDLSWIGYCLDVLWQTYYSCLLLWKVLDMWVYWSLWILFNKLDVTCQKLHLDTDKSKLLWK